ncbi:MAG: tetratricopeptide repeat protein [Bryobacteraceae bacterium]
MAEENQFEGNAVPIEPPVDPAVNDSDAAQPWNLVPVSAAEFAKVQNRRNWMIGLVVAIVLVLGGWIYKRNVDPIHALEAFDAGERLLKTARYSQAVVSFDRAISLQPEYAEAYAMRGRTNIALAKPFVAIPDFTKVIELRPRDPQAFLDRGTAYVTLQEWPEALADFSRAIELDPKLAVAYNLRGSAVRAMGDPAKAMPDFIKAVELLPNMDNIYQRGATYQLLGQHEPAIDDFSRVISFEPSSAQAYFARSQSFRAIGDIAAATRDHRTGRILDSK